MIENNRHAKIMAPESHLRQTKLADAFKTGFTKNYIHPSQYSQ